MKKRIFSMLLGLCLVLVLFPVTAFAETPGSLAIKVDGFLVGNTLADCTYTFESTIPGVTFSADDILLCSWDQYIVGGMGYEWHAMHSAEVFQADTRYKCFINLDNNGLTEAPAVTVNGKTPEYCEIATSDGVPYALLIECELGTPALLTIHGADVVCAQQEYEFTVTAAAGVTLGTEFGFDTGCKGSGVDLTIDSNGVGHGVMSVEWYDLQTCVFDLSVYGYTADQQFVTATKRVQVSPDHLYENGVCGCGAKKQYTVQYDGGAEGGLLVDVKTHGEDLTLLGETFFLNDYTQTGWQSRDGTFYALGGTYSANENVTLYPVFDQILTLTAPFTTTVALGGAGEPGKTTFELELVDCRGNELSGDGVTVTASVETDGAGDYDGTMTITGFSQQILSLLGQGAFVRQVNAGEEGWTYDDTVWGLLLYSSFAYAFEPEPTYSVAILPTTCELNEDGSSYYGLDRNANPLNEMRFVNTYALHVHEYTQKYDETSHWDECGCGDVQNKEAHQYGEWTVTKAATETEKGEKQHTCSVCGYQETEEIAPLVKASKTGDDSHPALWAALLLVSGGALAVTGVFKNRKKRTQ